MPTERFRRLPKEKAEMIRMAAIREFKRVPPEEASINKIIQDAEISRGSFYTYFEDKTDLLNWLINDGITETQEFYLETIEENEGDIWDLFIRALDKRFDMCEKNQFSGIFVNLIRSGMMAEITRFTKGGWTNEIVEQLYRKCDKTKCPADRETFQELMEMHMLALITSMKKLLKDGYTKEEVRKSYLLKMNLLRYGITGKRDE